MQVTAKDWTTPQVASPSEAATEMWKVPACPQVKVAVAADVLPVNVPPSADQPYVRIAGPESGSCAVTPSAIELPTATDDGLAETPSMIGQLLTVAVTSACPGAGGPAHTKVTGTPVDGVGALNVVEPEQPVIPSLASPLTIN